MWRRVALRDLVTLGDERLDPTSLNGDLVEHFSLPSFDAGRRPTIESASSIKSSKNVVSPDAVLVAKLNPHIPRVWMPAQAGDLPQLASTEFLVLRPRLGLVDRRFLYYVCWSAPVLTRMRSSVTGTSTSHQRVVPEDFLGIEVDVPELHEQVAIGAVLSSIDERVAADRAAIATANELMDAAIELAVRVGGSRPTALDDLVEFENKKRVPLSKRERAKRQGSYPYYGATGILDYLDGYIFSEPRVLVGEDGSVMRLDGSPVVQVVSGQFWVSNHAHVLKPKDMSVALLATLLDRSKVRPLVTGSVQPKLSMGNLKGLRIDLPSDESLALLNDQAIATYALTEQLAQEVSELEILRDTLASQLLSGRMRVHPSASEFWPSDIASDEISA